MPTLASQRRIEEVVLVALMDAHPDPLTGPAIQRELTSVENTLERLTAVREAVEGLVAVGLIARDGDLLRLTPPALRASEFDGGFF